MSKRKKIREIEDKIRAIAKKEVVTQEDVAEASQLIRDRHELLNPKKTA